MIWLNHLTVFFHLPPPSLPDGADFLHFFRVFTLCNPNVISELSVSCPLFTRFGSGFLPEINLFLLNLKIRIENSFILLTHKH